VLILITFQVDELLNGRYDSEIADFHIIDCRFDYEYIGGHITGAVNINTTNGVEDFLLNPKLTKPKQSISGDATKKTILIFHCEFSVKRAPTLSVLLPFSQKILLTANHFTVRNIYAPGIGP
jgi:M-phase inducer tyrosine phosphatase